MDHITTPGPGGLYLQAVRRRPYVVVLAILVAVAAAYFIQERRDPEYRATAELLITPMSEDKETFTGFDVIRDSGDPVRTMQTAAELVDSRRTAELASRRLGGEWTPDAVVAATDVQPQGESNILAITASSLDSDEAVKVANAFGQASVDARWQKLSREVRTRIGDLEQRQRRAPDDEYQLRSELARDINELTGVRLQERDPTVSFVQPAAAADRSGSSRPLVLALAALGGLALGVIASLLLDAGNRRIRDEEELTRTYPLPVLARIPRVPVKRGSGAVRRSAMPPAAREAYRTLALQLSGRDGESRSILVTSASAGDGKTTTSAALAVALADAGHSVIAIDMDVRRPQLGVALGASGMGGMTAMVVAEQPVSDALVACDAHPEVRVLPASPQDAEMLEGLIRELPRLLAEARVLADYVVLDTPPLGEVGDALRVADQVDDVVLVSRPGHTDRRRFEMTRDLLERAVARPAGLVLTGSAARASGYYTYGREAEAKATR